MKVNSEHIHQVTFINWLEENNFIYNATPNGGFRHITVAKKLKLEGTKKGFPDLTVYLKDKILFIELKKENGGVVSKEQKKWIAFLDALPYASAKVCNGYKEAIDFIKNDII